MQHHVSDWREMATRASQKPGVFIRLFPTNLIPNVVDFLVARKNHKFNQRPKLLGTYLDFRTLCCRDPLAARAPRNAAQMGRNMGSR